MVTSKPMKNVQFEQKGWVKCKEKAIGGGKTLILIFFIVLGLISLVLGAVGTINTFDDETNRVNFSFNNNSHYKTYQITIPTYAYIKNLTLKFNSTSVDDIAETDAFTNNTNNAMPFFNTPYGLQFGEDKNLALKGTQITFKTPMTLNKNYTLSFNLTQQDNSGAGAVVRWAIGVRYNETCDDFTAINLDLNLYDCKYNKMTFAYYYQWTSTTEFRVMPNVTLNVLHNNTHLLVFNMSNGGGTILGTTIASNENTDNNVSNSTYFTILYGSSPGAVDRIGQNGTIFTNTFLNFYNYENTTLDIEIGEIDGNPEHSNIHSNDTTLHLNITKINQYIRDGIVNISIGVDTSVLLYTLLHNLSYEFGIDNCTNSYNIPSNHTLNITTRDQITGDNIITNGTYTFDYYGDTDTYGYSNTIYNLETHKFCVYPEYAKLYADVATTFSKGGYNQLNYFLYDEELNGSLLAYLLEISATSQQVTYTITDISLASIEGANVQIYRNIDGVSTLIYEQVTDLAGQVVLYQDSNYIYSYIINASGYPIKTFNLQPISTTYTISIVEGAISAYDNPYEGLRYKILPATTAFNVSNVNQTLSFELDGPGLEYFGMNLTSVDGLCFPDSCVNISYSSTGGKVSIDLYINETGIFYGSFFFKRPNEDVIYINDYVYKEVHFIATSRSVVTLFETIREHTTLNQRTFIAALAISILCVIGAQLGIIGIGAIMLAVLGTIFFSLPMIGFIHPFVGIVLSTAGLGIYITISRFTT